MPNWCFSNITIRCESNEAAKGLYEKIKEWTSKEYHWSDFGKNWLGNIVGNSGIDAMEDGKDFSVKCRGSLVYVDVSDNLLIVDVETAWTPMLKMWVMICDRYLGVNKYKLYYCAEESSAELYVTNDPAFSDTYDVYVTETSETKRLCNIIGTDSALELSKKELVTILQEFLRTKENDVDILLGILWKSPAGEYVEAKKCKYADIADWD